MATRSASSSLRQRLIWTLAAVGIVVLISVAAIVAYYMAKFAPTGPVAVAPADQSDRSATTHHSGASAKINSNETTNSSASSDSVDENIAAVPPKLEPVPADGANNSGVVLAAAWNSPKPASDFHSAKFGYAVALSGTPWTRWENLADVVPDAEFGALLNDYGRLLVIPISLATLDPRPEALNHALLSRLGITYPSDSLTDFKTLKLDSAAGQSFRLTREIGGAENRYRVVIWRRGTYAYLVAAWIDRAAMANQAAPTPSTAKETSTAAAPTIQQIDEQLDATIEKFSLDHDAPQPSQLDDLAPVQKQSHAAVYNELGQSALAIHDDAAAIDAFRLAFQLRPDDPEILTDLVSSHVQLKQYREALNELEPNLARFENQPDLFAGRAFLLAELGNTEAALTAYAALFASGYRADAPFSQYITLLADNDHLSAALSTTQQYLQVKDSLPIRRLEASLYRRMGNSPQAIAILTQIMQTPPFNPEVAYDLCDADWNADHFADGLEVCRQLLEHHYDTSYTYWLQARCQYSMKLYKDSRQSIEAALKRDPANKDARDLLTVVNSALAEKKSR